MISPQSSLDALAGSQEREDEIAPTINTLSQNLGELSSEGSSGRSSEPVFRDSISSKRLGSAESASSGFSSSPSVFVEGNSCVEQTHSCTGCINKDSGAVAKCFDCSSFLCASCVMAHQFVVRFEDHHIVITGEVAGRSKSNNESEDMDKLTKIITDGKIKATEISKTKNLEATSFRLLNDIIEIDVGGKMFKSYRSTLLSAPGSLLSQMFDLESGLPPAKLQENGSYFIEGDPKIFEIILNFLRYKVITETPGVSMASVRMGAKYFGIQEMVNQIDVNIEEQKKKYDEKIEEQKKKYADVSKLVELFKRYPNHPCNTSLEVTGLERSIHLKIVHKSSKGPYFRSFCTVRDEVEDILKGYKIASYKVTKTDDDASSRTGTYKITYEMAYEMDFKV